MQESVSMPTQLGGGVRTYEDIERWIEAGVSRVVLGTVGSVVIWMPRYNFWRTFGSGPKPIRHAGSGFRS